MYFAASLFCIVLCACCVAVLRSPQHANTARASGEGKVYSLLELYIPGRPGGHISARMPLIQQEYVYLRHAILDTVRTHAHFYADNTTHYHAAVPGTRYYTAVGAGGGVLLSNRYRYRPVRVGADGGEGTERLHGVKTLRVLRSDDARSQKHAGCSSQPCEVYICRGGARGMEAPGQNNNVRRLAYSPSFRECNLRHCWGK